MALTFLKGRQLGKRPKNASSRADPISAAKAKILEAIDTQRDYAKLLIDGIPLPTREGDRSHTTWVYRESRDVWWTSARYGQVSIPLDGESDAVQVGKLEELPAFYNTVIQAIEKGELDEQIAKLQQMRSAAIAGKKGQRKTAPG